MQKYPKYLYRPDDGERWTLQSNNKYWMDKSLMSKKFKEYYSSYGRLIKLGFVDSLDKCNIADYKDINDGHGNGDFD